MKDTIQEEVNEVYKNLEKNTVLDKSVYDYRKNVIDIPDLLKVDNQTKLGIAKLNPVLKTINKGTKSKSNVFMLFILFILLIVSCLLVLFHKKVIQYIKSLSFDFNLFPDEEEKNTIEKDNEKLQKKIKDLEDKLKKNDKKNDKSSNKTNIKQQYSSSKILNDDGYCFIGIDDNMRHCVDAYRGDVCESGDVYKRINDCLVPKKSDNPHCGSM